MKYDGFIESGLAGGVWAVWMFLERKRWNLFEEGRG